MPLFIEKHICLGFKSPNEIAYLYKKLEIYYPKFFKMDNLSKMLFIATEQLLSGKRDRFIKRDDVAIIMFNSSSSLETDTNYNSTIIDEDNFFPSPSLFVYTLPNVSIGEVAIRNNFHGETSFYVMEKLDIREIYRITDNTFRDRRLSFAIVGWVDSYKDIFEVKVALITDKI